MTSGQKPETQEVEIKAASMDVHRKIAQDFLSTSATAVESVAPALSAALAESREPWWRRWIEILRGYPELSQKWQFHRRQGLESALRAALVAAGLDAPVAEYALREIVRSRTTPAPRAPVAKSVSVSQGRAAGPVLASLVQAVVARMGAEELRSLSLPLGLVLDVLEREDAGR